MIKYAVHCPKDHAFEAWFQSSAAFDNQVRRGLVACPACGSVDIAKSLMAPHVAAKTRKKALVPKVASARATPAVAEPAPGQQPAETLAAALPRDVVELMRRIRAEVEAKAEYVGPRFADEARKIHYDEAPERGIYGEASAADVKALAEEGIDCLPLPVLPEDRH